jgi:pseudouridine synthase
LQKVLAELGVASRRACETLIEEGAVRVNGHPVTTLPAWVDPKNDTIEVNGKIIRRTQKPVYVMLFKPRGTECTSGEVPGRRRAIDLVKHPSRERLFAVGRLDVESSGLLLMTNDGEFANRVTHPSHGVHKVYEVSVEGSIEDKTLQRLRNGLTLHDPSRDRRVRTTESSIKVVKRDRDRTRLIIELHEGRNRQIRRMLARVGHPVRRLRRIQLGPLKLKGLRAGQWRDLLPQELKAVKRAAGLDGA